MKQPKNENEPKQTTPKGYEIPARPRDDVLRAFQKIARPVRRAVPRPKPR